MECLLLFPVEAGEVLSLAWEQSETFSQRCANLYSEIRENYPGILERALKSVGIYPDTPLAVLDLGPSSLGGFPNGYNLGFEIELTDEGCKGEFIFVKKSDGSKAAGRPNPILISDKAPELLDKIFKLIPKKERAGIEKFA